MVIWFIYLAYRQQYRWCSRLGVALAQTNCHHNDDCASDVTTCATGYHEVCKNSVCECEGQYSSMDAVILPFLACKIQIIYHILCSSRLLTAFAIECLRRQNVYAKRVNMNPSVGRQVRWSAVGFAHVKFLDWGALWKAPYF